MRTVPHSVVSIAIVAASSALAIARNVSAAPQLPITTPAVVEPGAEQSTRATSVLIAPFRSIGETDKDAWISEAIDEQMSSDLSHNPTVHLLRSPTTLPAADPLTIAREQHADRLVTGSFQTIDDQIRVNGSVIDPSDGKTVAQLKVTGAKRDLFKLEDSLVAELEHSLPGVEQPVAAYTVTPIASDGLSQSPEVVTQADDRNASPQVVNNYYYDNGSGYGGYGDGGGFGDFGYPYFGSPFFYYLGGDRFHHFQNGDGNGGHNRLTGGGPIGPSPVLHGPYGSVGSFGQPFAGPSHGADGPRGPAGGGAMGGGAHGSGGAAGGHH